MKGVSEVRGGGKGGHEGGGGARREGDRGCRAWEVRNRQHISWWAADSKVWAGCDQGGGEVVKEGRGKEGIRGRMRGRGDGGGRGMEVWRQTERPIMDCTLRNVSGRGWIEVCWVAGEGLGGGGTQGRKR